MIAEWRSTWRINGVFTTRKDNGSEPKSGMHTGKPTYRQDFYIVQSLCSSSNVFWEKSGVSLRNIPYGDFNRFWDSIDAIKNQIPLTWWKFESIFQILESTKPPHTKRYTNIDPNQLFGQPYFIFSSLHHRYYRRELLSPTTIYKYNMFY